VKPVLLLLTACLASGAPPDSKLHLVTDVRLPGHPVRFDYQGLDADHHHLVIAHMRDDALVVVNTADGRTVKVLPEVPTVRGVAVGGDRIFATALPDLLVVFDAAKLTELGRAHTGRAPDGVAWDGTDRRVGVSDQGDGTLSILSEAGLGARTVVPLGDATGNVVYDARRHRFWITVEHHGAAGTLAAIDPRRAAIERSFDLPGDCKGAHGLLLHPDGGSAFVACEDSDTLVRVDLATGATRTGPTGHDPDVLSLDPGLARLYVAAEAGPVSIYDMAAAGVTRLATQDVGKNAHSVRVDPSTHHLFFPLASGPDGMPTLRIMTPRAP